MDFATKVDNSWPTASVEGDKDEKLNDVLLEVVDAPMMTSALLYDTEASKAMISNMDQTVSAEDKSDMSAVDSSKTREFPDVLFDKRLNKENLTEEIQSSTIQSIEID